MKASLTEKVPFVVYTRAPYATSGNTTNKKGLRVFADIINIHILLGINTDTGNSSILRVRKRKLKRFSSAIKWLFFLFLCLKFVQLTGRIIIVIFLPDKNKMETILWWDHTCCDTAICECGPGAWNGVANFHFSTWYHMTSVTLVQTTPIIKLSLNNTHVKAH